MRGMSGYVGPVGSAKLQLGIDSVYQAPSGAPVALSLLTFAASGAGPVVSLLRANPGNLEQVPGMLRVYSAPPNLGTPPGGGQAAGGPAPTTGNVYGTQGAKVSPVSGPDLAAMNSANTGVLYYFAGGADEGYWFYSPSSLVKINGVWGTGNPVPGALPFGQAPGTAATDLSDYQWALQQQPTWVSQHAPTYHFYNALQFLQQTGSQSTLSQVASAATTPSTSQIGLYAVLALGVAFFIWYEM